MCRKFSGKKRERLLKAREVRDMPEGRVRIVIQRAPLDEDGGVVDAPPCTTSEDFSFDSLVLALVLNITTSLEFDLESIG